MKLKINKLLFSFLFLVIISFNANASEELYAPKKGWEAGVARVRITPKEPMWMAGYAARRHPSEGRLTDLWAKVLALKDATGKRVVLVTMDLVGIPKQLSDRVRDQLKRQFHLSRSQIILNTSHTHSGPVLTGALQDIYPIKSGSDQQQFIDRYTHWLGDEIVSLVGNALGSMKPVQVYAGNGVTRFQVNRRNNSEQALPGEAYLNGPNDYAVPVIKVVDSEGKLMAVAFGYACHNTVLSGYRWSGDYAGFAQMELEKKYPGAMTLFFQGAGGDQNPLPRRSVDLAKQYGKELAASVETVVNDDMQRLQSQISTAYSEIKLPLSSPPTRGALSKTAKETSGYQKRWATRLLNKLEQGDSLRTSYPYPVEVWKLGDQPIIALGGEAVVEYAIDLKRIFGQNSFVLGYSNDVMAYIPTDKILREGGYEGATSQMVYGLPTTWASGIETTILHEVMLLAKQVGISRPKSRLISNTE